MLGVAFRASLLTKGLAGIQPVEIPGIENVDVTEHIDGHYSYLWSTKQLLELLEIDCYYPISPVLQEPKSEILSLYVQANVSYGRLIACALNAHQFHLSDLSCKICTI